MQTEALEAETSFGTRFEVFGLGSLGERVEGFGFRVLGLELSPFCFYFNLLLYQALNPKL